MDPTKSQNVCYPALTADIIAFAKAVSPSADEVGAKLYKSPRARAVASYFPQKRVRLSVRSPVAAVRASPTALVPPPGSHTSPRCCWYTIMQLSH